MTACIESEYIRCIPYPLFKSRFSVFREADHAQAKLIIEFRVNMGVNNLHIGIKLSFILPVNTVWWECVVLSV